MAYERCEQLDSILGAFEIAKLSLPWEAAFLAGKAFIEYRRRGGNKTSPLPDFYIGAHAMLAGLDPIDSRRAPLPRLFPRAASRLPRSRELIGA